MKKKKDKLNLAENQADNTAENAIQGYPLYPAK